MTHEKNDRIVCFDYLRVVASFAVIMLHVSAYYLKDINTGGYSWAALLITNGLVRWSVPVFVMISGQLALNKELSIKGLFSKRIVKLAVAFLLWSTVYALLYPGTIVNKLGIMLQGYYHMWFILMMIGLCISLPIIKQITKNESITKYYLLVTMVIAFLIPQVLMIVGDLGGSGLIKKGTDAISSITENMNLHFFMGYAGYYIGGYYLYRKRMLLSPKKRMVIYLLGIVGCLVSVLMNWVISNKTHTTVTHYYSNFGLCVLFESIAVFVAFGQIRFASTRLNEVLKRLSKLSLGAFFIHALVIDCLDRWFGLNALSFNSALAIIVVSIITFCISYLISAILWRIPFVKRVMV